MGIGKDADDLVLPASTMVTWRDAATMKRQ
jgi:hypothetical protein